MKQKYYAYILAFLAVFFCYQLVVFSQNPEKIIFQAVIRNSNDILVSNTLIGMRISILQGSEDGQVVYTETQTVQTNINGLVTLEIGGGVGFSTIDWRNGAWFIKTESDITGGNQYSLTTISQLLSVPYALHAQTAESLTGDIIETDPVFAGSVAATITNAHIEAWNNKLDNYQESQSLADVVSLNSSADGQIKHLSDPTDPQDAITLAYLDAYFNKIIEDLGLVVSRFKDGRDGNVYNIVTIGNQTWMAENLKYLPAVSDPAICSEYTPVYYVYDYYGNQIDVAKNDFFDLYGVLYNWPAAMNGRGTSDSNPSGVQGVCPSGWHIPSLLEWNELIGFVGEQDAALKLKSPLKWSRSDGITNEYGFAALPGGSRPSGAGLFELFPEDYGHWWTSTEHDQIGNRAFYIYMSYASDIVGSYHTFKDAGFYIRCVKN